MDIPGRPFEDAFPDKAVDLKRLVMEYVRSLRNMQKNPCTTARDPAQTTLSINLDADKFPLVPFPWEPKKYTKHQLEGLYASFLAHHYR
jgi:hypothetical protein